jgi:hypothetical protein
LSSEIAALRAGAGVPAEVSFVLSSGGVRDGTSAWRRLSVQPGTGAVRLLLAIDNHLDAAGYRVTITRDTDTVWSGDAPRARPSPGGREVEIAVPAALFADGGNYVAEVQALDGKGGDSPFESYSFGVVRR